MIEIIALGWSDYRNSYCMVIQQGKELTRWAIDKQRAETMAEYYDFRLVPVDGYFPDWVRKDHGL
jgi:hypothetical protein